MAGRGHRRSRPVAPAPTADPPEQHPKKNQTTTVDAHGIAQLVCVPGIVRRVDRQIVSQQQCGQGARHQHAVQHAVTEADRPRIRTDRFGRTVENPAERAGSQRDHEQPQEQPDEERADRFSLCRRGH